MPRVQRPAHTPEPWQPCEPGDYGDFDGNCIVILGDERRRFIVLGSDDEARADAQLIAAAPKMMEALRLIAQGRADHATIALSVLVKHGLHDPRAPRRRGEVC